MKKIFLPLIFAVVMSAFPACSPATYLLSVEMRQPSDSGLDLAGKDIAVMYLDSEDTTSLSSRFNRSFAEALSLAVSDANYRREEVYVYRLPEKEEVNYAQRDSLISLVMATEADAIFLLEPVEFSKSVLEGKSGTCRLSLHVYDTMNSKDKVFYFGGNAFLKDGINMKNVVNKAQRAGNEFSTSFKPNWSLENFNILYFEGNDWRAAVNYAEQYKWNEAMELWMKCLETDSLIKRSSAAYNLALACFMLGDNELAMEWLDSSDADCKLSISDSLRARIALAMKH